MWSEPHLQHCMHACTRWWATLNQRQCARGRIVCTQITTISLYRCPTCVFMFLYAPLPAPAVSSSDLTISLKPLRLAAWRGVAPICANRGATNTTTRAQAGLGLSSTKDTVHVISQPAPDHLVTCSNVSVPADELQNDLVAAVLDGEVQWPAAVLDSTQSTVRVVAPQAALAAPLPWALYSRCISTMPLAGAS